MIDLKLGDNKELLLGVMDNSVDMVLTSPPYDNIKNYNNSLSFSFSDFKEVAKQLYRVIKPGGVVIWVVADATIDGSETGTSFKQALYFMELGFKLYDTMIYAKQNYTPLSHRRYEQEFEYMFCFSKGTPKTFNPIRVPCKWAGTESWGSVSQYKTSSDELTKLGKKVIGADKIKGNIFYYRTGSLCGTYKHHPAVFPDKLAEDMIMSWTNEGDTVLDPFMGSGTSGMVCNRLNRNFIGMEIVESYYNIAKYVVGNVNNLW